MSIPIKHKINLGIALSTVVYVLADTLLDLLHQLIRRPPDWYGASILNREKCLTALTIGASMLMWGLLA